MRWVVVVASCGGAGRSAGTAEHPGLGNAIPGLSKPQTPEEKRAFCGRAAGAAAKCAGAGGLSLDAVGLTSLPDEVDVAAGIRCNWRRWRSARAAAPAAC